MKISYDKEADAAYIQLSEDLPLSAIEAGDGIHIDLTADKHIVGIEILDASKKISLETLYKYEFDSEMAEV
jgi:uncharacterized protein YuzE